MPAITRRLDSVSYLVGFQGLLPGYKSDKHTQATVLRLVAVAMAVTGNKDRDDQLCNVGGHLTDVAIV